VGSEERKSAHLEIQTLLREIVERQDRLAELTGWLYPPPEELAKVRKKRAIKSLGPKKPRGTATGNAERAAFIHSLRKPCMDCGESELRLIEFHHRDPATKLGSVAEWRKTTVWSEDQIRAEVLKCDCLCPTCHRKRHLRSRLP
jgi:hypothetical protein